MMYDLSSCNRILTTPIPLSYTRHTARFMVLWLALLPLALWAVCGWGSVLATALVSLALLTIGALWLFSLRGAQVPLKTLPVRGLPSARHNSYAPLLQKQTH